MNVFLVILVTLDSCASVNKEVAMYISISNLSYIYDESPVAALSSLTCSFSKGWTGIVGSNGAGKSTLLGLLCGTLNPSSGSITPSIVGAYCEQETELPPKNMEDFALDYSKNAIQLRSVLEIEDEWFWRFDSLSHGERKRIQIASALYLDPPILAIDEPTNHLDDETRGIVLKALTEYKGIGLLVSHDRSFLDSLVYQCLFLVKGKGTMIPGTYTQAKQELELRNKTMVNERKNARNDLKRLQTETHRRQAVADRSAVRRSGRKLDKHDNDGRAKLRLAVYSGQDGKTGLLSAQMDKKLSLAKERLDNSFVDKSYDKDLEILAEPSKRKVILSVNEGMLSLGELRKLSYPTLFIGNSDRIACVGRNGTGKSSFLSFLLSQVEDRENILYIPQEMTRAQASEVLSSLKELSHYERGQVLSIVARLNSPPERILAGDKLSPGELRKVMLAIGLLKKPYLVIMDEPTNHLDIHSIEALQEVLSVCCCALILVSHDESFLDALTTICWEFVPTERLMESRGEGEELDSEGALSELDYREMNLKVVLR